MPEEPGSVERVAVIDVGTNTVLLLVLEAGGRVIRETASIVRLGEGVFSTGRLRPEAAARARHTILEFAGLARQAGAGTVHVVGTAALRRAADGKQFLESLLNESEVDGASLLSPQEEARMAIEPARLERVALGASKSLVVVDVGGGSTEVVWVPNPASSAPGWHSLAIGSVSLTEACLPGDPPSSAERVALGRRLDRELEPLREAGIPPEPELVAVAGTATTLAALELGLEEYDAERVEGLQLDRERLGAWIGRLAPLTRVQRCRLPGLEMGRADVILAGLCVLEGVLDAAAVDEFRVSGRGVRFGFALRLLAGPGAV